MFLKYWQEETVETEFPRRAWSKSPPDETAGLSLRNTGVQEARTISGQIPALLPLSVWFCAIYNVLVRVCFLTFKIEMTITLFTFEELWGWNKVISVIGLHTVLRTQRAKTWAVIHQCFQREVKFHAKLLPVGQR